MDKLCVFRKPYHHPEENSALPVVSWPLDMRILHLPWKRLLIAGPRKHDGAPAYENIAGTSTYMFIVEHIYVHRAYIPTWLFVLTIWWISAPAGVVCWRGYSSLLLLHRPRSSSLWLERSWSTHLSLLLHQSIWASQVKALKEQRCFEKKKFISFMAKIYNCLLFILISHLKFWKVRQLGKYDTADIRALK